MLPQVYRVTQNANNTSATPHRHIYIYTGMTGTFNFPYGHVEAFFFFAAPSVHANSELHNLEQDTHNVGDVLHVRSLSNKNE